MSGYLLLTRSVSRVYSSALCTKSVALIGFCRAKQVILRRGIQTEFYCDAEIRVDYSNAVHRSLAVQGCSYQCGFMGHHRPGNPHGTGCISVFVSNHILYVNCNMPVSALSLWYSAWVRSPNLSLHLAQKFLTPALTSMMYWVQVRSVTTHKWKNAQGTVEMDVSKFGILQDKVEDESVRNLLWWKYKHSNSGKITVSWQRWSSRGSCITRPVHTSCVVAS